MADLLEYQWQQTQDLEDTTQSDMQVKVTLTVTVSYNGRKKLSRIALTKLEQIFSMILNGLKPLGLMSKAISTTFKSPNHLLMRNGEKVTLYKSSQKDT